MKIEIMLLINKIMLFINIMCFQSSLDYETKNSYELQVQASDGGTPSKTNTLNISISVLDVNDNPPVFGRSQYDLSLSELDPVLTKFGRVSATDRDSGQNGKIHYYIQENQTNFGMCRIYLELSYFLRSIKEL